MLTVENIRILNKQQHFDCVIVSMLAQSTPLFAPVSTNEASFIQFSPFLK